MINDYGESTAHERMLCALLMMNVITEEGHVVSASGGDGEVQRIIYIHVRVQQRTALCMKCCKNVVRCYREHHSTI
jgi:hypothetical protein